MAVQANFSETLEFWVKEAHHVSVFNNITKHNGIPISGITILGVQKRPGRVKCPTFKSGNSEGAPLRMAKIREPRHFLKCLFYVL